MGQQIYYCKSWFRAKKRATEIWSENQARAAHAQKRQYTVLVGSVDRPFCFLEIFDKVIGVTFLDDHLREIVTYAFQEVEPRLLFLSMATHREFEGDRDEVLNGTSYIFSRDGMVKVNREFFNPHRIETAVSSADMASNYSPYPEFGEYDQLIHVERC